MAEISKMISLGTKAPDFVLFDTISQQNKELQTLKSNVATVVMFLCNHCPYVKHIQSKLVEIAEYYQAKGIQFIGISSNDIEKYPEDGPEAMQKEAQNKKYPFPYLYDETQSIAKAFQATCTPDFFVFDKNLACIYRGRFDNATPGNHKPVTGQDLSHALDNIIANKPVSLDQKPSMGCSIKWKS